MSNAKPSRRNSPEAAALNDLLATMNNPNIQGVVVPPGVNTRVVESPHIVLTPPVTPDNEIDKQSLPPAPTKFTIEPPVVEDRKPEPAAIAPAPAQTRAPVSKIFLTGRLKSGKDFAATAAGAVIIGFADPLYAIASHYFLTEISSTVGKDKPGVREFLQTIGQWGRGVISEKYPLNVGRALLISGVRYKGPQGIFGHPEVAWDTFGRNENIWLDAAIARANEYLAANPGARVAITNCRFDNEFKRLQGEGWTHFHSLCSPATWTKRLAVEKLTPENPAVRDLSEQLAANLDANVLKQLSAQKTGPMLRAIWNDRDAPKPSERLHSLDSFLQSIGGVT